MSSHTQLTLLNPKRILVISHRFLGDTLLTTPLIHSLKVAYPSAELHVLVASGNLGILEGNSDIDRCLSFPTKSSIFQSLNFIASLFKQYDLAISCQASDRTIFYAISSGKRSMGFIDRNLTKGWWKKLFLSAHLTDEGQHTVLENLRFCDVLNINQLPFVIPPKATVNKTPIRQTPYVVLHIFPQWSYKQWTNEGWLAVITHLEKKGYHIVISGGPSTSEQLLIDELCSQLDISITNLAGKVSLAELSSIISQAALFIGPDTGITHLASATGCPTIAIFGPTNPQKWAPWPNGFDKKNPYQPIGIQQEGNVFLIQNPNISGCIPCQNEGCDRHQKSESQCLLTLDSQTVITVIDKTIAESA